MAAKQTNISSQHSSSNHTQEQCEKRTELVAPQPQQHVNVSDDNHSFDPSHVVISEEKSNSSSSSRNLDPCLNCGHFGIIQGQMIQDAHNNTFCGPNCGWSYFLRPDERERAVQAAAVARMKSRTRRSRRRSSRHTTKENMNQVDTQNETTNSTCQSTNSSKSETKRHKSKQTKSIPELTEDWMDQTMMNSMFQFHLNFE